MRILFVLTLGVFAATGGCMSDAKSSSNGARPSNGAHTLTYDCSGLGKGWGDCTEKAEAQCGVHNYTIVSQNGEAQERGTGGNSEMKRTLAVSCMHQQRNGQ